MIQQAQHILGNSAAIACTACHYCTAGCPKKIAIPEILAAANKQLANGQKANRRGVCCRHGGRRQSFGVHPLQAV